MNLINTSPLALVRGVLSFVVAAITARNTSTFATIYTCNRTFLANICALASPGTALDLSALILAGDGGALEHSLRVRWLVCRLRT